MRGTPEYPDPRVPAPGAWVGLTVTLTRTSHHTTRTPVPTNHSAVGAAQHQTSAEHGPTPTRRDSQPQLHWLARDPLRSGVLVIAAVALVVRFSVVKDSYFITDDFMLTTRALENDFGWSYLMRVHTGHLEPIGFATMWVLAHAAPLSWGWAVFVLMAGQAVLLLMVWRLLVELFGRRPLLLAPYAVFAFTPLTLPGFTWLAAAIIWLPLMVSVAGAMTAHARFVREGRARDAAVATLWLLLGLASFEKMAVYLPFALAYTVALSPSTPLGLRPLLRLLRRTWLVWVGYLAASALYLALYWAGTREAGASATYIPPRLGPVSDFVFFSVFRTFIPAVFGGPWTWQPHSYGLALVNSPRAFDWLCWIAAAALLLASLVLRSRIGRWWFALGVYLAGSLAAVAVGRVGFGGAIVALETRYLADAAVPLVVVLAACLMPLRGESMPWTPLRASLPDWLSRRALPAVVAGGTGAVVLVAFHAMSGYAVFSTQNPAREVVANTRRTLPQLPADAQVFDQALQPQIIGPLFEQYNLVSRYLAPLATAAQRHDLYTRRQYTKPYMVDASGRVVPMAVVPGATSTWPAGSCVGANRGRVVVPLSRDLFVWDWVVRVGYVAETPTTATVRLGSASQEVHLDAGLGEVYVSLVGAGRDVVLDDIPAGTNVCVGDVQAGNPGAKG